MRYLALATDYDGTVAHAGHIAKSTVDALERVLASGRKLILVTGRELPDLPQVKETADFVTQGEHGQGVAELIAALVDEDLRGWDRRLKRHHLLLGTQEDGTEVRMSPYANGLLIAGPSGSGKSTAATSFLE